MGTIKRRTPVKKVNRPRKKREFERTYHSRARVEFVKSLPCSACGVVGYSQNAHVPPKGESGTGYKAGYRFIAPLCGFRQIIMRPGNSLAITGCHTLYDVFRSVFDACFPDFDAQEEAAKTEQAWKDFSDPNRVKDYER